MNRATIDDLASRLADSVPGDIRALRAELENNFRALLSSGFDQLDLVTREEFDVQRKVLERTREKVERLERELLDLQRRAEPERGEG